MKQLCLKEIKKTPQMLVVFSEEIADKIDAIDTYNQENIESLNLWYDYLDGLRSYISNRAIAFDYDNRYRELEGGGRFIDEYGYNISYTIQTDDSTNKTYVYIFGMNLNTRYFGLTVPFYMDENKHINKIVTEVINQYLRQNLILN